MHMSGDDPFIGAKKSTQTFFVLSFSTTPSGHGRPGRKSWTSAPKSAFSCGPGGVEKFFVPWASGCKGQECPREIRTKKFMFMLLFLPGIHGNLTHDGRLTRVSLSWCLASSSWRKTCGDS